MLIDCLIDFLKGRITDDWSIDCHNRHNANEHKHDTAIVNEYHHNNNNAQIYFSFLFHVLDIYIDKLKKDGKYIQQNGFASCQPSKEPWDGRLDIRSKIGKNKSDKSYKLML